MTPDPALPRGACRTLRLVLGIVLATTSLAVPARAGGGHDRLGLSAQAFARAAWIDFGDLNATLQDNALTLAPGKTISLRVDASVPLDDLREALQVRSLVDALRPSAGASAAVSF